MRTEDQVRDDAKIILGFDDSEDGVQQGTGQITTFNQLGFSGNINKPDGWYLPKDLGAVAIVLETKAEQEDLSKTKWVSELQKNIAIVRTKYSKVVGILYNGTDIRVFKNDEEITGVASTLQHKHYYKNLYLQQTIDKQRIYSLTKQINDTLHTEFGIKNLYHRMIFTACALVAKRYGALLYKGMDFPTLKSCILSTLNQNIEKDLQKNLKLKYLTNVYNSIEMNNDKNQEAINNFISWISTISECVNSDYWNGEDVMGIFFNEFNRYKKKTESGQVFTPDHITSFMYRLIDVNKDDRVLDAACGSGAFLVKAMCNMIREVGGVSTKEAKKIKDDQLFGIEFDKEIFALACANMLIHKDGKTNLEQLDSRTQEASDWIKSKEITKVLMNPPFERKYGCLKIVKNVLDSVPQDTKCAFILPDKKLEKDLKDKKYGNKILKDNTLTTIVKFPENLFFGQGVTTSVFVFIAGRPQNGRDIVGYYIEEDGLETVKNQGRQDVKNRWPEKEDYWIRAIQNGDDYKYNTRQIINPREHLSYQKKQKPIKLYEKDFVKTMTDYELYCSGMGQTRFKDPILSAILYNGTISQHGQEISIKINPNKIVKEVNVKEWGTFTIGDLMHKLDLKMRKSNFKKRTDTSLERSEEFNLPLVNAKDGNNGIMYYGREKDFDSEEMCIDIVQNGAVATGNVYAQIERTGVLWDAYLVKTYDEISKYALLYLAMVMQKMIKQNYSYEDKAIWEKVKLNQIILPKKDDTTPDWDYMDKYMRNIKKNTEKSLKLLITLFDKDSN